MSKLKKMLAAVFGLFVGISNLVCFAKAAGTKIDSDKNENQGLVPVLGSLVETDSVYKNEGGEFLVRSNRSFSRSKTMFLTLDASRIGTDKYDIWGFLLSYFLAEYVACVLVKNFSSETKRNYSDEVSVNVRGGCFNGGRSLCYELFLEFPIREDYKNEFEAYIDRFENSVKAVGSLSLKDLLGKSLDNTANYKEDFDRIFSRCSEKLNSFIENLETKKESLVKISKKSGLLAFDFLNGFYDEEDFDIRIERIEKKIQYLKNQLKVFYDKKKEVLIADQSGNYPKIKKYLTNLIKILSDKVSIGFCEMSSVSQVVTPKQST